VFVVVVDGVLGSEKLASKQIRDVVVHKQLTPFLALFSPP
jgi:hypothetical protein